LIFTSRRHCDHLVAQVAPRRIWNQLEPSQRRRLIIVES